MLTEEYRYKILKLIEINSELSQREIAYELGISVGKTNFCIKALIEKGLIKVKNFQNSKNKLAYMYLLTPKGLEVKAGATTNFLKIKMHQYEALQSEIEQLRKEINSEKGLPIKHEK